MSDNISTPCFILDLKRLKANLETARRVRESAGCKILLATNHKPKIANLDFGIWRRIKLVPFKENFSGEREDKHLKDKLIAEGAGILNWALAGFRSWHEEGLGVPDIIEEATAEYKDEHDELSEFFEACCRFEPGCQLEKNALYQAYLEWNGEVGGRPVGKVNFGRQLNSLFPEISSIRGAKGRRLWVGLALEEQQGVLVV